MTSLTLEEQQLCEGVRIAVIGGSGLYHLPGLVLLGKVNPETPWGYPSSSISILEVIGSNDSTKSHEGFPKQEVGTKIAFLARHGHGHKFNPSEVPYKANIAALKHIGIEVILAFSAVGSLQEHIKPCDFAIPTQAIDRTKGIRDHTFFQEGIVGHVGFADPFFPALHDIIFEEVVKELKNELKIHPNVNLVCMEGPVFSTRAESNLYRSWGMDIINMSAIPECKLAKECEIAYQMICMATDYDCWKVEEESVTVETVINNMKNNSNNAKLLLQTVLPRIIKAMINENNDNKLDNKFQKELKTIKGSTKYSIMTSKEVISSSCKSTETANKLKYVFPTYF